MNKARDDLKDVMQRIKQLAVTRWIMRNKRTLAIIVIAAFVLFFGYYIIVHPDVITNVLKVGPVNAALLLVLYFGVVLTNFAIMLITIRLCQKKLAYKSGLLLTMYSSIVNFFGPLQSGPAVRAVYLKTKVGLRIRDYTYAMLFYYFAYAAINASLLFINKLPWLSALGIAMGIVLTAIGTNKFGFGSRKKFVFAIFIITAIQILFMTLIYAIELNAVDPSAHYTMFQMISYTASANLSLFVSLTPGGVGIREAFLIFAQSLHNVPLSSIVAAGILDRAVYIIFLVILFVVSSGLHLKQSFTGKQRS